MELTWLALAASLMMGFGAAGVFAVRSDYFRDLEDVKYQVFWSGVEGLADQSKKSEADASTDGHR